MRFLALSALALAAAGCDAEPSTGSGSGGSGAPAPLPNVERRPVSVRITGRAFEWHVQYAGLDNQLDTPDDVYAKRHLHLPAFADVSLELISDDYVYGVYIDPADLVEAVIPNIDSNVEFEVDEPSRTLFRGNQLCGFTHPKLIGELVVHERDEYDDWLRAGGFLRQDVPLGDDGAYHVRPGMEIQDAVEVAASDPEHKVVKVHAGTYRPRIHGQALVWFNAKHDGVKLEAVGDVVLTAANEELSKPAWPTHPSVVNHVLYFGDGVTPATVLDGFTLTGGNGFKTNREMPGPVEPNTQIPRNLFFYADGAAVKIFGRSYPTIRNCQIRDNYADPCAGAVSIHHPHSEADPRRQPFDPGRAVRIENCIFDGNRARVTGSAVDLLWGSTAMIENCLFVGNISNTGTDPTIPPGESPQYSADHGCGAVTVFRGSRVVVRRSTFTANYSGVDDMSAGSVYENCIFWQNTATGGIAPKERFELAVRDGSGVRGCMVNGAIDDLWRTCANGNQLGAPDPHFDDAYRPTAAGYENVGYRPADGE